MKNQVNQGKVVNKKKFLKDHYLKGYTRPRIVESAQEMLCLENLSEEGFLGAQAVLLLNGIL